MRGKLPGDNEASARISAETASSDLDDTEPMMMTRVMCEPGNLA